MTAPSIKRCFELTDAHVAAAVESRETTKVLLEYLASIAKPNQGAPKMLLIFARMATNACEWLDGDLRVEIKGDGDVSVMEIMTELGGGLRERALPSLALHVPLVEFARAVERVPKMVEPLMIKTKNDKRIVLASVFDSRGRTVPPPPVRIDAQHLVEMPGRRGKR
jgi:hypothetical protein